MHSKAAEKFRASSGTSVRISLIATDAEYEVIKKAANGVPLTKFILRTVLNNLIRTEPSSGKGAVSTATASDPYDGGTIKLEGEFLEITKKEGESAGRIPEKHRRGANRAEFPEVAIPEGNLESASESRGDRPLAVDSPSTEVCDH